MTNLSFKSKAVSDTTFAAARASNAYDMPYDANLSAATIIHRERNKREVKAHSLNPVWLLNKIKADNLKALAKISLPTRPVRNGVALWETLMNMLMYEGVTSCLCLANSDFSPLSDSRVSFVQTFLDYKKKSSRIVLNRVEVGDELGIGIYNATTRKTHVLIYRIDGFCLVKDNDLEVAVSDSFMLTCANLQLQRIYEISANGSARFVSTDIPLAEGDLLDKFVSHLNFGATDVEAGWAWKPHFVPMSGSEQPVVNGPVFDEALGVKLEHGFAAGDSYDDFEDACRQVYDRLRAIRVEDFRKPKPKPGESVSRKIKIESPTVQICQIAGFVYAHINGTTAEEIGVKQDYFFTKESVGTSVLVEKYLLNSDLEDRNPIDTPGVYVSGTRDEDGNPIVVRWLKMQF